MVLLTFTIKGKVVLNVYFLLHICNIVCEYCVNAVFTAFALLVNVLQTRYLICVQI